MLGLQGPTFLFTPFDFVFVFVFVSNGSTHCLLSRPYFEFLLMLARMGSIFSSFCNLHQCSIIQLSTW